MAETVIEATVQVMVEKLIVVVTEEIGLLLGVKRELTKLKESLIMIQAVLQDAARRQVQEETMKLWLKKLEDVAYEADNVLDEFHYETLRRKVEIQNQMKRKICFFFSFTNPLVFRFRIAHEIRGVVMKLKTLDEEASRYGLQKKLIESALALPPLMETNSISVDPVVLGRENDVSEIVDMKVNPSEEVVSVVPIIGIGGLGKTTLARLIVKDARIVEHFDETIWVCASKSFDSIEVFKRILEILTKSVVHEDSMEAIVKNLQERLMSRRYLLIVDDLWVDRSEDWENFKNSLIGINSNKGNFVIATTRLESVASILSSRSFYSLGISSVDDCWSLIKRKAFLTEEAPREFETIGKEITYRCGGLH